MLSRRCLLVALPVLLFAFFAAVPEDCPAEDATARILRDLELEDLVEPVALYPDVVISALLPASTFPDQIVDAAQLMKDNPDAALIQKQQWDKSVKAIAAYPGILKMMFEDLKWTTDLGQAFLSDHRQLLAALQRARTRAVNLGKLKSNSAQTVTTRAMPGGDKMIAIQPASPNAVNGPAAGTTTIAQPQAAQPADPQSQPKAPQPQPAAAPTAASEAAMAGLATFGAGMALGAALEDEDDYYYGGYWGEPVFWGHEEDNFDKWADHREEVWENYNDRRRDPQDLRQSRENRQQFRTAQGGQALEQRAASRTQATTPFEASTVARSWGDSGAWSKPAGAQPRGVNNAAAGRGGGAFQGYQSGARVSAMSARGAASRGAMGGGRGGGGRR